MRATELLSHRAELMEEKKEPGLCLPGFVCCYSCTSVCLLFWAGYEPKAAASGRINLVAYCLGGLWVFHLKIVRYILSICKIAKYLSYNQIKQVLLGRN